MAFEWEQKDNLATETPWEVNDSVVEEDFESRDPIESRIGFVEAAIAEPATKIPFAGGVLKVQELEDVLGATQRINKGKYEDVYTFSGDPFEAPVKTPADVVKENDIKLVSDYLAKLEERQRRGYTTLGRVGQITSEMPAFVIEFIATGGLQKMGATAGKKLAVKALKNYASTNVGKAAIATSGFAVGVGLRAAGMPHRAAEAILRRQAPQYIDVKDDGTINVIGPVEKPFTSIYKGVLDHYIEIASEQTGEYIAPVLGKAINKTPFLGKFISKLESKWLSLNKGKKTIDFLEKIRNKSGFHGVLSEVGEEYLGDTTRAILDVDDFGAGQDAGFDQRLAAAVKSDTAALPAMLISFSIPGVITSAVARDLNKQDQIAKEYREHVNFITGLEINSPSQIETAEGILGYESELEFPEINSQEKEYKFDKPGISKYFTPKWLLNRILGVETLLKDVDSAEISLQLEQKHLGAWINKLIPKLRKEKGLARLPYMLPVIAEQEIVDSMKEIASSIPLGLYRQPTLNLDLRDLDDEQIEFVDEKSSEELDELEKQLDENIGLEDDIDFRKKLAASQDRYNAIQNEKYFRSISQMDMRDILNEFLSLRPRQSERDKLKTILLIYAVKSQEREKEFNRMAVALSRNADLKASIQSAITYVKNLAKEVKQLKRTLVGETAPEREPIKLEETKAHILQTKIDYTQNPIHIMRDLLDTYEDAPSFLTENETQIFNQVRELTRYLRQRANLVREKMGLEPIAEVKGYITHWMDSITNQILAKDLPIHSGYLYKLMQGLPKEVKNPTAMKRKILKDLDKYFSKDLGKLLRIMVAFDLKDIYLKKPYEAAWDELQRLRKDRLIPDSTYKEVENYLLYDIRKHKAPMDKAFNKTLKKPVDLLNKILPIKNSIDDPSRSVFSFMRRLGILSGLGLRPRPANRNLAQRLLLADLYRTQDIAKAQAVAFRLAKMPIVKHPITGENIKLIDLIREQDWYRLSLQKFEDIISAVTAVEKVSLHLYSRTHVGNLFLSNVEVSAITGYFDWLNMYNQSKDTSSRHFKNCFKYSKKHNVPLQDLLTKESDMLWNIREAIRRTQWEYFSISMPTIYRSQFNRAMFMFQSWWMNYFFNHSREVINQTITGRNSLGRLLTPGGRLRAAKGLGTIVAIGKAAKTLFGVEMLKYLFVPLPGYLPPIPELIVGLLQFFAADDDKEKKRAWKRVKYGLKFWIPLSAFGRDLNRLLSGEYNIADFLLYRPKEKK